MASYTLFGVHDWAARLIPGLAGLLTVLLTYFWGRRVVGERAGLCGALGAVPIGALRLPRTYVDDGLPVVPVDDNGFGRRPTWHSGAVGCIGDGGCLSATACAPGRPDQRPYRPGADPCAHACILSSGPACRSPRSVPLRGLLLRSSSLWPGRGTSPSVAVEPGFAASFFWKHNVVRFLAPFDHEEPFWFHLPPLFFGMLPWSLLLPGFLRFLFRRRGGRRLAGSRLSVSLCWPLYGRCFFLRLGLQTRRLHRAGAAADGASLGVLPCRIGSPSILFGNRGCSPGVAAPAPLTTRPFSC